MNRMNRMNIMELKYLINFPLMRYDDEPVTEQFEMIYLNSVEGRTHVQTGIMIYHHVNGTFRKELKKMISRFWVLAGVAFFYQGYFHLKHDMSLVLKYERLRKLPKRIYN